MYHWECHDVRAPISGTLAREGPGVLEREPLKIDAARKRNGIYCGGVNPLHVSSMVKHELNVARGGSSSSLMPDWPCLVSAGLRKLDADMECFDGIDESWKGSRRAQPVTPRVIWHDGDGANCGRR